MERLFNFAIGRRMIFCVGIIALLSVLGYSYQTRALNELLETLASPNATPIQLRARVDAVTSAVFVGWIWQIAIAILGPALAVAVTAHYRARYLALHRAAQRLAVGGLDAEVGPTGDDELGQIAQSLQEMQAHQRLWAQKAMAIGDGAMDVSIEPRSNMDALGHSMAYMVGQLRRYAGQAVHQANQISGSTGQVSAATDQVTQELFAVRQSVETASEATKSASETAEDLAQIAQRHVSTLRQATDTADSLFAQLQTTLNAYDRQAQRLAEAQILGNEIQETIQHVADHAGRMAAQTQAVARRTLDGREAVQNFAQGLQPWNSQMRIMAQGILDLSVYSEKISRLAVTLTEAAEQSNLHALNMTIEAAHSKEKQPELAHRTSEIQKWAQRSTEATRELTTLAAATQTQMHLITHAMIQGSQQTGQMEAQSVQARESLATALGEMAQAAIEVSYISEAVQQTLQSAEAIYLAFTDLIAHAPTIQQPLTHALQEEPLPALLQSATTAAKQSEAALSELTTTQRDAAEATKRASAVLTQQAALSKQALTAMQGLDSKVSDLLASLQRFQSPPEPEQAEQATDAEPAEDATPEATPQPLTAA